MQEGACATHRRRHMQHVVLSNLRHEADGVLDEREEKPAYPTHQPEQVELRVIEAERFVKEAPESSLRRTVFGRQIFAYYVRRRTSGRGQ